MSEAVFAASTSVSSKTPSSLSRQYVWILYAGLASHKQPKFSHAFGSFARLRSRSLVSLILAIGQLLVEFLLAALTFLLEALHDVYGTTYMTIVVPRIETIASSCIKARGLILAAKGVGSTG